MDDKQRESHPLYNATHYTAVRYSQNVETLGRSRGCGHMLDKREWGRIVQQQKQEAIVWHTDYWKV